MFESYKDFNVFVETDPKSDGKVNIVVQGKLVERNEKQTIVNVKGRLRKIKNELVLSVLKDVCAKLRTSWSSVSNFGRLRKKEAQDRDACSY